MGDILPIDDAFEQTTMQDDNGKEVSVVKIDFSMKTTVEESIYQYLTKG